MLSLPSGNKSMVLNVEQRIPSVCISVPGQTRSLKISDTIDHANLTTDPTVSPSFPRDCA